ncbi:MAG: DNA polymerase I [Candidatus Rokubacteria bacterium]|nr:DNA polymerase I [Candidatus Rokubacteria bacterium]
MRGPASVRAPAVPAQPNPGGGIGRGAEPPSEKLYLIDGPSLLYRAYHAISYLSTSRGVPTHAVFGMSTMLWKLLREEQPDHVAVAWDAPGPTFRHEAFEAYKIQRPGMPDDLAQQIPHVKALFEGLRVPLLEVPGFEADDILGTLVDRVRELPLDVVLVTADKDLLQLVGPKVRVLSQSAKGERLVLDEAGVREKWEVEPAQIPDLLALMGDQIDNIPGVPGVGEKTAVKLIKQFGSVERLLENLPLVGGKLRETLATNRKQVLLSRELATVSARVPLALDLETLRRKEPDWERLRALWTEMEFSTLLKQIPQAAVRVEREPVPLLSSAEAFAAYCRPLPAAAALALDWCGGGGPPDPALRGLAFFHPEVGPAFFPLGERLPPLDGRLVIGHDVKLLLEWALRRGEVPLRFEDSAVAAYLLNPARTSYPLEELCLEAFGEGPPPAADPGNPPELMAALAGERARWVWRYWKHAHALLEDAGLRLLYEDVEQPLVPVLARMELTGIRVAPEGLEAFAKELERELDNLTREIHRLAGEAFNIGSPKQLAQILFEKLKLPPVKRTKTGYSTDADVLEQLALGHPLPQKILEHRTLAKLKSTYADALPGLIHPETGRIHTSFNQLVTATGRLSSSDPNVQNIPIRGELARRIREAFIPEEGWRFLAADYSQIELRILAHLSGEEALIDAFRRGDDIHARTAVEMFKVAPGAVTPEMRRVAKGIGFGVVYGISAFGLAQAAGVDQKAAQQYLDDYFLRHPKVKAYLDGTLAEGREKGYVTTLLGRRRYLPDLKSTNPNLRGMAERMAMNAPVQGSAADLIKIAMVRTAAALETRKLKSRMLLQVHDELLFEAPEDELRPLESLAHEIMEGAMTLAVPLKVDIKTGPTWADV